MTPFTERIHEAMDFAAIHHRKHKRKDPDIRIPYLSHLFGVAYILAEYDLPEDVVVAGILHDFLEDVVQKEDRPDLVPVMKKKFGPTVFRLVSLVTQQKRDANGRKIKWEKRGEAYLKRLCLKSTPVGARQISCADKIHNIESLRLALKRHRGHEHRMWDKLHASPGKQVQKFQNLHDRLAETFDHKLLERLEAQIVALKKVIPRSKP